VKLRKGIIRAVLRGSRPPFASRHMGVGGRRLMLALLTAAALPPKGTRYQRVTVAGVPVERVQPPYSATNGTLIYLHGGAYALGSAKGYRGLVAQLAAAAGMTALVPDYSRAPEAQYPIALEEMVAVYSRLLEDGLDPKTTVIAGDSAGGGLTLALTMALRDRGIALPAVLGLICPWADLAIDIDGMRPVLRDPLILPSMCTEWAPRYAGSSDPRLPGISPVYGDMTGLPPIIMQSAGDDPISADAVKIETACATEKTAILDHRRFDNMWHDFHLQVSLLPEARDAVVELGAKLRSHLPAESPQTHAPTKGRSQVSSFEGKVAVITGAGSGIGRALALNLAKKGTKLALSDIDTDGLAETVRQAKALGANVKSDRLNVAEREAVLAYADAVVAHFGTVNQVYNNAGIAYNGNVDKSEFKDIERIMDVDFWGVVNGTKAFLPHVIASGDGHVVNISSVFGLIAIPGQSAYNAAKFAVRGFTEALRQEMLVGQHPVKVTCVHPGGIKTAVARNATVADGEDLETFAEFFDKRLAHHSPEMAAETIVNGVAKGHARVLVGWDAKAFDWLARITGSSYQRIVAAGVAKFFPWAK
jgi:epsilon-lactone hydrolase